MSTPYCPVVKNSWQRIPVKLQSSVLSNEHVSERTLLFYKYRFDLCSFLFHNFKKLLYFTVPIDQVAVPVGGKAYLPCDTRNEDLAKSRDSSGFYMVMWFKEQKENNPLDQSYEQSGQSSSSVLPTSGEPIFT